MSNRESVPTPSTEELRRILSVADGQTELDADALVHTALGMYDNDDYLWFAEIAIGDPNMIDEVAMAEARLRMIDDNDMRVPGCEGQSKHEEQTRRRLAGIDRILETLTEKDLNRFFDVMAVEGAKLENDQLMAEIELPDTFDNF